MGTAVRTPTRENLNNTANKEPNTVSKWISSQCPLNCTWSPQDDRMKDNLEGGVKHNRTSVSRIYRV